MKNIYKIINEPFLFLIFIISYIPGFTGVYIRRFFFKLRFRYLGKKFYSEIGIVVSFPKNISIGNNCSIMRLSSINACKESQIKIGDNASINYNVNINIHSIIGKLIYILIAGFLLFKTSKAPA